MVQVKIVKDESSLTEIYSIWEAVFKKDKSDFKYVESNLYIILYEGLKEDKPIGAAMIRKEEDNCFLENIAIVEEKRNQQNGEFLLRFMVDRAFQLDYEKLYAITEANQGGLFQKIGFEAIDDDKINSNTTKYQIKKENFYKKCNH